MDLWPWTIDARRSLLSTFEELDDAQWKTPTLCDGWTVRDVLAHLVLAVRPPLRRYAIAVARAKGNFDRANHDLAVADAHQAVEQLLADYRSVIEHRFGPPGWPDAAPLSDILLHTLDVHVPLGLPVEEPAEHFVPVMELLLGRAGRSFARAGRPTVHWVATDHDWSQGKGPDVRGAMSDLALTAAGRSARAARLDGDGVADLDAWLR